MSGAPKPSPLHRSAEHESAAQHVTGRAVYTDDLSGPAGTLHAVPVVSPHAHARIVARDKSKALAVPGVVGVFFHDSIPGHHHIGPIVQDEPLMASDEVFCAGHPVAVVLGETLAAAHAGAAAVRVEYEPLPARLTVEAAIEADAYHGTPHVIQRGDRDAAWAAAVHTVEGEVRPPAQDHFYLETHASLVLPEEAGTWRVVCSTQHPTEVQQEVASVLGVGSNQVVCEVPRMGGGFGGKESQSTPWACLAAVGAWHTGRPVKIRLNREQDMAWTGKRHPFLGRYKAGFDAEGQLLVLEVDLFSNAGWSHDLSLPVLDRALFHLDNACYVPALRFEGRACNTHLPSNTAFRGFGGPQGIMVIEEAFNRLAERQGWDPAELRARNFYGAAPRDRTPYGQAVPAPRLERIWDALKASSDYAARRAQVEAFNAGSPFVKRGLGVQFVKFGISFTKAVLNQAGALLLVYADGTVQLNHGGTEMGQGLHTKMLTVCAHELGVPKAAVRVMTTATDKVPNTSATAASSGSDLNGAAVREACVAVRERMRPVAAQMLNASDPGAVQFAGGRVFVDGAGVAFKDVALQCWLQQVSLSATGFYRTPGIAYDEAAGQGTPFFYFAYGAAVLEVELNGLTGEHRVTRADILHDVGDSLVPSIDRGQVEGAFMQGYGWLTCEECLWDDAGHATTTGPSTYKVPAVGEAPLDFRVDLLPDAAQEGVIHGSKAVGEPPFMLGIAAVTALRHAVQGFGDGEVQLALPATPENLLRAVEAQRAD